MNPTQQAAQPFNILSVILMISIAYLPSLHTGNLSSKYFQEYSQDILRTFSSRVEVRILMQLWMSHVFGDLRREHHTHLHLGIKRVLLATPMGVQPTIAAGVS